MGAMQLLRASTLTFGGQGFRLPAWHTATFHKFSQALSGINLLHNWCDTGSMVTSSPRQ